MATITLGAIKKVFHQGDRKRIIVDLVDTGAYVVNGDLPASGTIATLIGADFEINNFDCQLAMAAGNASCLLARYNDATGKVQLYTSNGAAPAAFAELTAIALPGGPLTIRCVIDGKGAITPQ